MGRPRRSFVPGGFYHVTARGNGGRPIFLSDHDRVVFVHQLRRIAGRFCWRLHAWCLMGNHFHLVVETPNADLPRAMQQLNGGFARVFNKQHGRTGHVFRARYTATAIGSGEHLAAACDYVLHNPVRAGILARAEEWPWSSAAARVVRAVVPPP